jgi:formylglycine-generating enzyme required for sulfatase activity
MAKADVTWSVLEGSAGGTVTQDGLYTAPFEEGEYHVVATSDLDPSKSARATVTVVNNCALSCDAFFDREFGAVPFEIQFAGNVQTTGCVGEVIYLWEFGDGTTSTMQNPMHIYDDLGTYDWSLSVTVDGRTCAQQGTVYATNPDYENEITVFLPGEVPLVLSGNDQGYGSRGAHTTEQGALPDERPQHMIHLSKGFYMGRYEVTQEQWEALMGSNPAMGFGVGPDYPVYNVSWNDVAGPGGFIKKLNEHLLNTGQLGAGKFRLPTEAEWEVAVRAGWGLAFSFGEGLECSYECDFCGLFDEYMVWCGNAQGQPEPVGSRTPNAAGLYDMHGNVGEWMLDWYEPYPAEPPEPWWEDPMGAGTGTEKVWRGGHWESQAVRCRCAARSHDTPDTASPNIGFRVVRTP